MSFTGAGFQAEDQTKRPSLVRLLAIVGDVASITGISLLWFRESMDFTGTLIVKVVVGVAIAFGFVTLIIAIMRQWHVSISTSRLPTHITWKVVLYALVLPLMIVFGTLIGRVTIEISNRIIDAVTSQEALIKDRPTPTP